MTGAPIDNSIRGTILPTPDRGNVLPDSKRKLAPVAQLVMEPGVERISFKFQDGNGLIDSFGNVYEGYGGAGGASISVSHTPPTSLDETNIGNADDDQILVYDEDQQQYLPQDISYFNVIRTDGSPEDDTDILVFDFLQGVYVPQDITFFDIPSIFDLAVIEDPNLVQEGYILKANADGNFDAVDFSAEVNTIIETKVVTDFISGIIEVPQNRVYTLVQAMPYEIVITNVVQSRASGSATIGFPSGTIAAGNPLTITVGGASGGEEFLRFQIDFERTL